MDDPEKLYSALEFYYKSYEKYNNEMWSDKLGFSKFESGDEEIIIELTSILQKVETDMTIFFRLLSSIKEPKINHLKFAFYDENEIPEIEWNNWLERWWSRVDGKPDQEKMKISNPKYVLRNWMSQLAIDAAEKEDYSVAIELYELLKMPYEQGASGLIMDKLWSRNYISISCIIVQKELLTKYRFKEEFKKVEIAKPTA